jgi:SEC-C motif-containing protein
MRSRYSAYALKDVDYILRTWHPRTRPKSMALADDGLAWTGLTVHEQRVTGKNKATVEFTATYRAADGSSATLHEKSRFLKEGNAWLYLDGAQP